MALNTKANIVHPDNFYDKLIHAHDGFNEKQSAAYNARLILLLANHIGDEAVLDQALEAARLQK